MKPKQELKLYFENGDKPTQEQFWQWMDSYWHKEEKIPYEYLDLIVDEGFMYSPTDNTELIGMHKSIIIPEGTKIIGSNSFSYTAIFKNYITKVVFPDSLEKIKSGAFALQYINGSLRIPGSCKIIETRAFSSYYNNLDELILNEGIEIIEASAFQLTGSTKLLHLNIPDSVKSVGQDSFAIPSLQTVSVRSGLNISNTGIPSTAVITYR